MNPICSFRLAHLHRSLLGLLLAAPALPAATLTFDADPATAGAQDGTGVWEAVVSNTNWWNSVDNTNWDNAAPDSALFGAGTGTGVVTLAGGITVGGLTFNTNYTVAAGTLTLGGGPTVTAGTTAGLLSALAGASGFTKAGAGDLLLGGDNSGLGGTIAVNAGRILLLADAAGSASATWTLTNGATVLINNDVSGVDKTFRLGALNGVAGTTLRAGGNAAGTNTFEIGALGAYGLFAGLLTNSPTPGAVLALRKVGAGTQILAGDGINYSGWTTVEAGRLVFSNANAMVSNPSPAGILIAPGAVAEFAVPTGTKSLGSILTNSIAGGGTLVKSGSGTLALCNQGGAQYKIALRMTNGLIDVQAGTFLNGGWAGQQWTDGSTFTNRAGLRVTGGGKFDIWDGMNPFFDALTGDGTVDKNQGAGGVNILNLGINNGSGFFNGTLKNTQTFLALAKHGTGTQVLSGANIYYTGGTTVTNGLLVLSNTTAFASGSLAVYGRLTIHLDGGNTLRYGNTISGGPLTKAGAGTLSLFANNTYTGALTVAGGLLVISNSVYGPMSLASGATALAVGGQGLVGSFHAGTNGTGINGQPNPNFVTAAALGLYLATNNPTQLYESWGKGANFDFGNTLPTPYQENFVCRFTGKLNVTNAGTYVFTTVSDDGSMLWIDGALVVNNNYYQGPTARSGSIVLTAGLHDIVTAYYEHGGGNEYRIYVLAPGAGASNLLANAALFSGPGVGTLAGEAGSELALSNGWLTVGQTAGGTFAGTISGPGGLYKIGTGTLALAGANTFTDRLTAAAALLRVDGTLAAAPATAAGGGVLGGTGVISGVVTVEDSGRLNPAAPGIIGTLTAGSLLVLSNGFSAVDINAATSDQLIVTGTLTASNAFVEVNPLAAPADGSSYVIGSFGTLARGYSGVRTAGNTNAGKSYWLTYPGNQVVLNVGARGAIRWGGTATNAWDVLTTTNWVNVPTATLDLFYNGDSVVFDDSPGVAPNVYLAGTVLPANVVVSNEANSYVLYGAGKISGPAGLVKLGTGLLVMSNAANDFTGDIVISNGAMRAGAAGSFGNGTNITVKAGGQVQLHGIAQAKNYQYTIEGAGPDGLGAIVSTNAAINQNCSVQRLVLSGNATVGTLGPGNNEVGRFDVAYLGWVQGNHFSLTKVGNSVLSLRGAATNLQTIINAGMVNLENTTNAAGTNIIVNAGGYLGAYGNLQTLSAITLNGGTLSTHSGGGACSWIGPITLAADSFANTDPGLFGYGSEAIYIDGVISGPGRLTKLGGNAVHLRTNNTYTGGTVVSAGNLVLGSNTPAGEVLGWITNNANLYFWRSDTYALSNQVSGSGSVYLRMSNGMTLVAGGSISNNVLNVGDNGVYSRLVIDPGAAVALNNNLLIGNPAGIAGDVVQHGGDVRVGGTGTTKILAIGHYATEVSTYIMGGGTLTVTNAPIDAGSDGIGLFTVTGGTVMAKGLMVDGSGATAALNGTNNTFTLLGGAVNLGPSGIGSAGNYVIQLGGGTLGAYADWASALTLGLTGTNGNTVIAPPTNRIITLTGALAGTGGYSKADSGTLVLGGAGANTFTGPTAVNAGLLAINRVDNGPSPIAVNAGGTLGGTGSNTVGLVAVYSNGVVQPGYFNLPLPFTVSNLTLAGGGAVNPLVGGTAAVLRVTGNNSFTVPAGADVALVNVLNGLLAAGTYTVIDYAGDIQGGTVANLALGARPPRATMSLADNPGATAIELTISDPGAIRWTGATDANWDINATTNWQDAGALATTYLESNSVGDLVVFDDTALQFNVAIAATVSPARVTVLGASNYVFSGAGIGGAGSVVMGGSGRLQLAETNGFTGPLVVTSGVLAVSQDANLGAAPGVLVSNQLQTARCLLEITDAVSLAATRGWQLDAGLTVLSNGAATATCNGPVAGPGGLVKAGGGTLQIQAAGVWSGGLTIEGGTVQVNGLSYNNGVGSGVITNNGLLDFRRTNFVVLGAAIRGTGSLSAAYGTVCLSAANNFTGQVIARGPIAPNGGYVGINGDLALGAGPGGYVSNALVLDGGGLANMIQNADAGWTSPGAHMALHANRGIYLGASNGVFRTGYAYDIAINSVISGPGKLIKTDGGTNGGAIVLNAANTITNNTEWIDTGVGRGVIRLGVTNALAWSTVVPPNANNAKLDLSNLDGVVLGGLAGGGTNDFPIVIPDGKTLYVGANGWSNTFAARTAGGALTKIGSQPWTITGSLNNTGAITVAAGTLNVSGGGTLFNFGAIASTVTVQSGATLLFGRSDVFGNHSNQPVAVVSIEQGGLAVNTNNFITLFNLALNGGELRSAGSSGLPWGSYQLKGTVTGGGAATSLITVAAGITNTLTQIQIGDNTAGGVTRFDVADAVAGVDFRIDPPLVDGRNASNTVFVPCGLIKLGAGTLALNGTNTYTGPTLISNGTLLVQGALGPGDVAVLPGATLGGTGLIAGLVSSTGTVAPGASAGLLRLGSGYSQGAAGNLVIELGGTAPGVDYDRLVVAGLASLSGKLTVTNINGFPLEGGQSFTVLTASALSGWFTATDLPALPSKEWVVTNVDNSVVLNLVQLYPFDVWAAQHALGAGSETNDYDGDGFNNLLEYSQNSDPTNGAVLALMSSGRTTNGLLQLKFSRYTNAVDITYVVEGAYSATNGAIWTGLNTNYHGGEWTAPAYAAEAGLGATRSVTVSDTAVGATNRYLRLRVTKP